MAIPDERDATLTQDWLDNGWDSLDWDYIADVLNDALDDLEDGGYM